MGKMVSGLSAAPKDGSAGFKTKEFVLRDGRRSICGVMYRPVGAKGRLPAVVLSHGYGGNMGNCAPYAEIFAANGFACCAFDFRGGGANSRSSGATTEMSVLTEAEDLEAVLAHVRKLRRIDNKRVFLWGESQGGFVSAYVAARRAEQVRGLVLFYPAFVLQDAVRERFPNPADIPETAVVMGNLIGAVYARDLLSFDIYDAMQGYRGDVLIVHGDRDALAPLSYSERAQRVYASAELKVIPGGYHGFWDALETPASMAVEFLKAHI